MANYGGAGLHVAYWNLAHDVVIGWLEKFDIWCPPKQLCQKLNLAVTAIVQEELTRFSSVKKATLMLCWGLITVSVWWHQLEKLGWMAVGWWHVWTVCLGKNSCFTIFYTVYTVVNFPSGSGGVLWNTMETQETCIYTNLVERCWMPQALHEAVSSLGLVLVLQSKAGI